LREPLWDNLLLREGEDYNKVWIINDDDGEPIDFSVGGYSFALMIRNDSGSDEPPAVSLTSTPPNGIALGADGSVTVTISRATIATAIASGWDQRPRGVFSAVMTDPGNKTATEVEGPVRIRRMPTR
jgi:hypothetical protein